ncbi:large conductance mechanosensitive channel protein MscL [Microbacterium sp. SGAir0570]|uniref:large conductance mechanosensitive channel protein MscL n=1 Tax=Microbacterium sp. SGAir0570 TaxID=2070348 RepID=UPI0010CD1DAF|nr:large conductance mechanosensitive channel protein MscL [Microbacterium sp. SGAir0570]QCR40706.1 large conductance mechanosensitive channel protein MscL [Microbacterium sp. SGAir0570]
MIKGFRDFIMRGNVIDLAVAVVIGGAFTAVVNAIVSSIINPLVELFYQPNEEGIAGPTLTGIYGQPVPFPLGGLITAIISFFAVALVVYFVFVVPMNKWKERQAAKAGVVEETAKLPTEQELLIQIRDLLEKNNAASSTSPTPAAATDAPLRRSQNTPPAAPSA